MLNEKLRVIVNQFKSIGFDISYNSGIWDIIISGKGMESADRRNTILESDEKMYEIMMMLIPGYPLADFYGNKLGDEYSRYSITRENENLIYYSARLIDNKLTIKETTFDNELDLYIHLFKSHNNLYLIQKVISGLNIKSPLEILKEKLSNVGYSISGFKHGGQDDEGYTYSLMILLDSIGKKLLVQYPERDALLAIGDFIDINNVEILSFSKDQLNLLQRIKRDELSLFIEDNLID